MNSRGKRIQKIWKERWSRKIEIPEGLKEIPRYPGYYASQDGSIFSSRLGVIKKLKPCVNSHGYYVVTPSVNNRKFSEDVHSLILETFVGPRKEKQMCCHGPNGPLDNSLGNLCWGDIKKNLGSDKERDGTKNRGTAVCTSKLSEDEVLDIRKRYSSGLFSQKDLSYLFKVRPSTIRNIVIRKIWAWI